MSLAVWVLLWGSAVFYAGGLNPLLLGSVAVLLALPLLLGLKASAPQGSARSITATDGTALLLLLWLLCSIPFSDLPAVSYSVALVVASLPLTYFLVRQQLLAGLPWSRIEAALRWVGSSVALMTVLEALIKQGRPFGTFEDANAPAALWNVLFFPLYLQLLARWRAGSALRELLPGMAYLLLLMTALVFSNSLGGQLCFMGGLFLATLASGWRRAASYKALALAVVLFVPIYTLGTPVVSGRDSADRMANLGDEGSFTERVEMVKSTWQIYQQHPLTGSGLGTYKILYPAVRSVEERSTTGDLAHNDYIQFLAEGGPLLLGCLLALLGITAWRLLNLCFRPARTGLDDAERWRAAGYAVALMCLLMHAVMNFIFYVLPLAMVAGAYLARLESVQRGRPSALAGQLMNSKLPQLFMAGLVGITLLVLGSQSLFVALSSDACGLRACREIRQKDGPVLTLANVMVATQPSWLPARDYLIARLRDDAARQLDPAERQQRLKLAAQEVIGVITVAPAVHYPYALLADLLVQEPSIAAQIPEGIPRTAAGLYATTLSKRPQDQVTRLALARQLEQAGQARQAFDLVNDDGMRWWQTFIVKDSERIAMLRFMIPRAVGFGLCDDARGMAGSLGIFVPQSALAKAALGIPEGQGAVAGCGLTVALPAE